MKIKTKSYLIILMLSLLFAMLYFFVFGEMRHLDGKITKAMMASRAAELWMETRRVEGDYLRTGSAEKAKTVSDNLQKMIPVVDGSPRSFSMGMPQAAADEIVRQARRYEKSFAESIRLKEQVVEREEILLKQGAVLESAANEVLEELQDNPRSDDAGMSASDFLSVKVDKILLARKVLEGGQKTSAFTRPPVSHTGDFSRDLRNYLTQKLDRSSLVEAASHYVKTFEELDVLQEKLNSSILSLHEAAQFLDEAVVKNRNELEKNRSDTKRAVMIAILAAFLICGLLGLSLALWLGHIFTGPLLRLRNAMLRIAGGDMDVELYGYSEDEIGELAQSFQVMQSKLKNSYDDLHKTNDKLAKKTQELERSNQEFEQFAHVISHDLKEPIRTVSIYTEMLAKRLEGRLEEKEVDYVEHTLGGCRWMYALIDDLLTYARTGSQDEPMQMTDTGQALNKALMNLTAVIRKNQAEASYDKLPVVFGNGTQLTQLFQNLIVNAIKFRRSDPPQIHIEATCRDKVWCFSVRDNGIGIESKQFDRIFVVFQRLHTRNEYSGTGIGLAVCKKIVERHHGKIWVESKPGAGSVFYFTIPEDGGTP